MAQVSPLQSLQTSTLKNYISPQNKKVQERFTRPCISTCAKRNLFALLILHEVIKPHLLHHRTPFFYFALLTRSPSVPSPLQIAAAAQKNRESELRAHKFPVATRGLNAHRQFQLAKRRDAKAGKALIKPENADQVLDMLPAEEGETLHALICGDFVFCNLITRLVERLGSPASITLATLSVSLKNLESLEKMMRACPELKLHIVLSHYFQTTSKEIFIALETLIGEKFAERFTVTIGRSHAKVALIDYGSSCYVIETSANLRSSGNLEQLAIFRERELYEFHATWIEEFRAASLKPK